MASSANNEAWRILQKRPTETPAGMEEVASALAQVFQVQWHEVALLRVRGHQLEFVFPRELNAAGTIPLSSSAIAARTATSQQAALFNDFTQVIHHSVFEVVPLGTPRPDFNPNRIHKLMSAPVIGSTGLTIGVVQISRKGPTRDAAGPDFTDADLRQLETAAQLLTPLVTKLTGPQSQSES